MNNFATIKTHDLDCGAIEIAFQLIALGKAISGAADDVPDNNEPTKFGGSDVYSLGQAIATKARQQLLLIQDKSPNCTAISEALAWNLTIVAFARAINNGLAGYLGPDPGESLRLSVIAEELALRQSELLEAALV